MNVYATESDEAIFKVDTSFDSFHCQAKPQPLDLALLAGFLMLWLKRCVIPTTPKENLLVGVVYPAVLLAHGHPLSFLSEIVYGIQNGLRVLTEKFCKAKEVYNKDGSIRTKTSNSQIELPYTYLMTWFMLHCSTLMSPIK